MNLQIIGITIGVIAVLVSIYFGIRKSISIGQKQSKSKNSKQEDLLTKSKTLENRNSQNRNDVSNTLFLR
ncbi:unnamed protein product [marine sediment metagenome]|uniref:Uncharacterized protein n=1 Tax=marine sediment metagenome TaxID=412755 RepID=X1D939_9ZZZZ